jgi:hypothetical protein
LPIDLSSGLYRQAFVSAVSLPAVHSDLELKVERFGPVGMRGSTFDGVCDAGTCVAKYMSDI